jgi:hypothetical protein
MVYGSLGQDGALERVLFAYDWNDAVSTTFGVVLYQSGDSFPFSDIDDNNRIFSEIKYSY